MEDVERLRRFEEEVLLRRFYEYAAAVLESAGCPSVAWSEQLGVAESLKAAVDRVDPELGRILQVVAERRPIVDDGLDYDRQQIRLRPPLPVELVGADETLALHEAFEFSDPQGERYAAAVWMSRSVATGQFAFPGDTTVPDPLAALIVPARTADGSQVIRIGLLPPGQTPTGVQDDLGAVPLVVLTSHSTLRNDAALQALSVIEPVFVVMDMHVAWHVDDWVEKGGQVRVGAVALPDQGTRELLMAVFTVDLAPGMRFLSIGGRQATSILIEQLRRRYRDGLSLGRLPIGPDELTALNIVVDVVLSSWHILGQEEP